MTTLSEQELKVREIVFCQFVEIFPNRDGSIITKQDFNAGFEAGLTYNRKRIEELEAKVKELQEQLREELGIG